MLSRVGSRSWATILAGLVLVALCGTAADPARARPTQALGFNETASLRWGAQHVDQARIARLATAAGAELQRIGISWSWVQPSRTSWQWDRFDRVVRGIRRAGMKPLIMIEAAPAWARVGQPHACRGHSCPPDAAHLDEWGEFAARVANRYKPAAIEIWNWPSWNGHWTTHSGPDPVAYARVFGAAAQRIHRARPEVPVLYGGTVTAPQSRADGMSPTVFLEQFYAAVDRGLIRKRDGLATTAFMDAADPGSLTGAAGAHLAEVKAAVKRLDPGRSLWITEAGMTTTGADGVSRMVQRDGLETLLDSLRRDRQVRAVVIHSLLERPGFEVLSERGWGLVTAAPGFVPKPAYCLLVARAIGPLDEVGCDDYGRGLRLGPARSDPHSARMQLRVRTPGPGRVVLARSRWLRPSARRRPSAGWTGLRIRPTSRLRKRLAGAGTRRRSAGFGLRIRVRFIPDHGDSATMKRSVRLRRAPLRRAPG